MSGVPSGGPPSSSSSLSTAQAHSSSSSVQAAAPQQQGQQAAQQQQKQQAAAKKKKPSSLIGLDFPVHSTGQSISLKCLTDDASAWLLVVKTCQALTQVAGHGSHHASSTGSASTSNSRTHSSRLWHDQSRQADSDIIPALITCLQQHTDRRCRVAAATTLSIVSRAAATNPSRSNKLLQGSINTADDELDIVVGNDVPSALVTAALTDSDDGVAITALASLGRLVLDNNATTSNCHNNHCNDHLRRLRAPDVSPYAPTLRQVADEDPDIPSAELRLRIVDNILVPRVTGLLQRMIMMMGHANNNHGGGQTIMIQALPILLHTVTFQIIQGPKATWNMSRDLHSKRWMETTSDASLELLVQILTTLLPRYPLALSLQALELLHACTCHRSSSSVMSATTRLADLVAHTLTEQLVSSKQQQQPMSVHTEKLYVGALLVALRRASSAASLLLISTKQQQQHNKQDVLYTLIAPMISAWPATEIVPATSTTPGMAIGIGSDGGSTTILVPARIQYWTEVALSYFLDDNTTTTALSSSLLSTGNSTAAAAADAANTNEDSSTVFARRDALRSFLSSPAVTKILTQDGISATKSPISMRDELLVALVHVARVTGPRWTTVTQKMEWAKLSRSVLVAFWSTLDQYYTPVITSNSNSNNAFTLEDTSLTSMGLAGYLQLFQSYLQMCGLLQPSMSAALKLAPSACPPHLWFDHDVSFGSGKSSIMAVSEEQQQQQQRRGGGGTDTMDCLGELETSSKLASEMVARELKHGIAHHHLRLHLIATCADQWVQARLHCLHVNNINGTTINPAQLAVAAGRDLCLALAPKRLLQKMIDAYNNNNKTNDGKRDPLKKWSLETVRVCVACLENIALVACDWRKRFNYADAKPLVSVAVGLLQGKVDETPMDDFKRHVMGPLCDAAVSRIQACYERLEVSHLQPELSVLVSQPHKTKIKPLISSSSVAGNNRNAVRGNDYYRGYLAQLCRQIVHDRTTQAIDSLPLVDATTPARPTNWLRLGVPPVVESRDARSLGMVGSILHAWDDTVRCCSSPSDPTAVILACTPRRELRYDGAESFHITVMMRAHNISAVPFTEGLRLEIGVINASTIDLEDPTAVETIQALGGSSNPEDFLPDDEHMFSASSVFRDELAAGENLTWEVPLDPTELPVHMSIVPSIVYRNIPLEPEEAGSKWVASSGGGIGGNGSVAGGTTGGDASTAAESKSGEDDFRVSQNNPESSLQISSQTTNIRFSGEPLVLSPLFGMQPCPLVFMRDRLGDFQAFRYIWFRLQWQAPPLVVQASQTATVHSEKYATKLANLATLSWNGEAIPGGYATRAWAFSHLSGSRILFVLAETEDKDGNASLTLYLRGDNKRILFGLVGTFASRVSIVNSLVPGMVPIKSSTPTS